MENFVPTEMTETWLDVVTSYFEDPERDIGEGFQNLWMRLTFSKLLVYLSKHEVDRTNKIKALRLIGRLIYMTDESVSILLDNTDLQFEFVLARWMLETDREILSYYSFILSIMFAGEYEYFIHLLNDQTLRIICAKMVDQFIYEEDHQMFGMASSMMFSFLSTTIMTVVDEPTLTKAYLVPLLRAAVPALVRIMANPNAYTLGHCITFMYPDSSEEDEHDDAISSIAALLKCYPIGENDAAMFQIVINNPLAIIDQFAYVYRPWPLTDNVHHIFSSANIDKAMVLLYAHADKTKLISILPDDIIRLFISSFLYW
jgi:hypothetical protein